MVRNLKRSFGPAISAVPGRGRVRTGVTLIEVLVATAITLILVASVAQMFTYVSNSVVDGRAAVEMSDRLRLIKERLQLDLRGCTAPTRPPLRPEADMGYFEYIEGPIGSFYTVLDASKSGGTIQDELLDDVDDILMFTALGVDAPFTGLIRGAASTTPYAEIAWFMRGTNLYRRVLLIRSSDDADSWGTGDWNSKNFYQLSDLSMRLDGGSLVPNNSNNNALATFAINPNIQGFGVLRTNSLGDLTKRENRYGHLPTVFPHDARAWGVAISYTGGTGGAAGSKTINQFQAYGLPTLVECGNTNWPYPYFGQTATPSTRNTVVSYLPMGGEYSQAVAVLPITTSSPATGVTVTYLNPNMTLTTGAYMEASVSSGIILMDGYDRGRAFRFAAYTTKSMPSGFTFSYNGSRLDDLVMTGVAGFDVKAWDPGAPVFEVAQLINGAVNATSSTTIAPGDPNYQATVINFTTNSGGISSTSTTIRAVGFGSYADLNYMGAAALGNPSTYELALRKYETSKFGTTGVLPRPHFGDPGNPRSRCDAGLSNIFKAAVYDTWSTHYEYDGIDQPTSRKVVGAGAAYGQDGLIDPMYNGLDDDGNAGVDDANEAEAPPPYAYPLRGIQVTIRAYEPDTKQVREVHMSHEFTPD